MFDDYIEKDRKNIVNTVCDLIKFKSISQETDLESLDAPFGEECKKALEYTLKLGKKLGFKTKNIDGYCGYIEFGEGSDMVGIIGHLDVVPALEEDGWSTPPFEPSIRANKIFGRGSIDDKGPVVAALYAMKAVSEIAPNLNKRVRLILGLNEEKSWKCINRYKKTEEIPFIGFSPDANFPAIYAEKGIISIAVSHKFKIKDADILEINCNNNALNVVPKYCSITLKLHDNFEKEDFKNICDPFLNSNITVEFLDDNIMKITSLGKASHAAHPEDGNNAITNLVKFLIDNFHIPDTSEYNFLEKLFQLGFFDKESPEFLSRDDIFYPTQFNDYSVIQDESGILTSNIANLEYNDEILTIKINLRVPVKTSLDLIFLKYRQLIKIFENANIQKLGIQEPLYIEKDSFLVETLVDIFNRKTESFNEAIAIGGGTYARAFENCVSYGVTMPGEKDMCHQVDEYIDIDTLILSTQIYAEAIYALAKY